MEKKWKAHMEELDFSRDSHIRESLLEQIKRECFCVLDDDALDFLNAAGTIDEISPLIKSQKRQNEP